MAQNCAVCEAKRLERSYLCALRVYKAVHTRYDCEDCDGKEQYRHQRADHFMLLHFRCQHLDARGFSPRCIYRIIVLKRFVDFIRKRSGINRGGKCNLRIRYHIRKFTCIFFFELFYDKIF